MGCSVYKLKMRSSFVHTILWAAAEYEWKMNMCSNKPHPSDVSGTSLQFQLLLLYRVIAIRTVCTVIYIAINFLRTFKTISILCHVIFNMYAKNMLHFRYFYLFLFYINWLIWKKNDPFWNNRFMITRIFFFLML